MSDNHTSRPVLDRENFVGWHEDFEAYMGTKGLWRMREERTDIEAYETKKTKASGEIWLAVPKALHDDIRNVKGDPKAMLAALEAKHDQKVPGVRFKAYNDTLISDISGAVSFIRRQRPDDFDIEKLDAELATMVALRALRDSENPDHRSFVTQFLSKEDLSFEDVENTILRDFQTKPKVKQEDVTLAMAAQTPGPCYLCDGPHFVRDCEKLPDAKQGLKTPNRGGRGRGRGRGAANTADSSTTSTTPTPSASASRATQSAGKVLLHT